MLNSVLILDALLLLCLVANTRYCSFRLQLLSVACGSSLGPACYGLLRLLWWPSLCVSLCIACWILRYGCMLVCVRIEHVLGAKTTAGPVARVSKQALRAQKKSAKKKTCFDLCIWIVVSALV